MDTFKDLIYTVGILVLLAVAYASFWVLVILFVAFIVYNLRKAFREEEW